MILIPGATCSGDEWNETVQHLSKNYECHVITLAGYAGTTPLPNGPYLETMKNQIEEYIRDRNLNNVILIGHSIGGMLSLWIASEMNDHLQKALIVDAMPFFAVVKDEHASDTFNENTAKAMLADMNKMNNDQLKFRQAMTARYMCSDSAHWDIITTWGIMSDKKTMAYTMNEMNTKDLRKTISNIKIPVLVLGAYSYIPQYPTYTRESVVKIYGDQYKACSKCTVHVAEGNTKHFVMYDNPKWYFKEMDAFFKP